MVFDCLCLVSTAGRVGGESGSLGPGARWLGVFLSRDGQSKGRVSLGWAGVGLPRDIVYYGSVYRR